MIPGLGRSPGGGHGNPLQYSIKTNKKYKISRYMLEISKIHARYCDDYFWQFGWTPGARIFDQILFGVFCKDVSMRVAFKLAR